MLAKRMQFDSRLLVLLGLGTLKGVHVEKHKCKMFQKYVTLLIITSFVKVRALTRAVSDLAENAEDGERLCPHFNASAATGVFPHSSFLAATFILSRLFLYERR